MRLRFLPNALPWGPKAYQYWPLPTDDDLTYTDTTGKPGSLAPRSIVRRLLRFSTRRLVYLLALVLALALLATATTFRGPIRIPFTTSGPRTEIAYPGAQDLASGDRRFVIVLPVDGPSPDLCKVVTSAIAAGYPAPILANWGKTFDNPGIKFGGSHIGKIFGTLEYLDAATSRHANAGDRLADDDLVLMVDAHDVWFQLPPQVLLRRYHEANQAANGRLAHEWGGSADDMPMKQSIIAGAQKRCFPDNGRPYELHCDALPNSTMREDVYGPKTDDPRDSSLHSLRPKYINSGTIMGPVGDMKRLFRRVADKVASEAAAGLRVESDQGLLGEVYGEQSVWRNLRRRWKAEPAGVPEEAVVMMHDAWEYHVGLDYEQGLFVATYYEEEDGRFLALDDEAAVKKNSVRLGVSPVRLDGAPRDVVGAPNPLADLHTDQPKVDFAWGNLPLYADFFTAAVPSVVHHNAKKSGAKNRRTAWWDKTWFFADLRAVLDRRVRPGPLAPLAKLPTAGGRLTYWPPGSHAEKRRVRAFDQERMKDESGLEELQFGDVCRYPGETEESSKHWYDEVFRDGKGAA